MKRAGSETHLVSLARRAAAGEEKAMEQLLLGVHPHVLRYLERWLHESKEWKELAKDLAQDTLVRIARGIACFRGTTDREVVAWCVTIARNIGTDQLRAFREEADLTVFGEELGAGARERPGWNAVDDEGSEAVRILLRLLRQAQDSEPDCNQELLWLRVLQHDSWHEVGEALGIGEAAAKRRYQRIQERMRLALLRALVHLPPEEVSVVRRWLARADVAAAA
jgi:RNA polymerase sigma-70 factor (ECF subfamily)